MRVAIWHQHGSWTTAFVQGSHDYLVPVNEQRDEDGRGRAATWSWPATAQEVSKERARYSHPDVVVVQRPIELSSLVEEWFGLRPGIDVPTVVLEHNMPRGDIAEMRHWAADRPDLFLVHVTHHNALLWDVGTTPSTVVEHGIPDPGHRYSGELEAGAAVINDAVRRWRLVGTDLLGGFAEIAPVDLYGMGNDEVPERVPGVVVHGDLTHPQLHREVARRRCYLHLNRWTSLGLSLIEAMMLGVPPLVVGATDAPSAVPAGGGLVTSDVGALHRRFREYLASPERAVDEGRVAREAACARFALPRFLQDWDEVLKGVSS